MTEDRSASGSAFIVRAETRQAIEDAHTIRNEAEDEVTALRAHAEDAYAAALDEARRRGQTEAAAEVARMLADAAEALDGFWEERASEVGEVAFAIAHRILDALPRDDLMAKLAAEAIAEHRRDVQIAVRTHPNTAESLRTSLRSLNYGDRVTIAADPACEPGNCVLIHPSGRTNVGLLAQFRAVMGSAPPQHREAGVQEPQRDGRPAEERRGGTEAPGEVAPAGDGEGAAPPTDAVEDAPAPSPDEDVGDARSGHVRAGDAESDADAPHARAAPIAEPGDVGGASAVADPEGREADERHQQRHSSAPTADETGSEHGAAATGRHPPVGTPVRSEADA